MRSLDEIFKRWAQARGPYPVDTDTWSATEGEPAECPVCGGAGFVQKDVPLGHPDFGRAFPCRCVLAESQERRLARLQRYSNLGALTRHTFTTLSPQGRFGDPRSRERYTQAVAAARAFAEEPQGWLVVTGPPGCGKTHLAAAIANRCLELGHPAFYAVVSDLLDHLRAAYRPDSELAYDALFPQLRDASLLILDDLTHYSATPWAQEKLFQLINHRYSYRLPTVITLSVPLLQLDERLRTRVTDQALATLLTLGETSTRRLSATDILSLPTLQEMTFNNFWLGGGTGISPEAATSLRNASKAARDFAEAPQRWLVLLGGTGCGKTHLAAAIGHSLRAEGRDVEFCVVPDLLEMLRSALRDEEMSRQFEDTLERVRTAPYLILDDLGIHSATAWAQEKLFQILNYRYNARLPTVITVGRALEQLPEAWVSRMYDPEVSFIFEFSEEVADYRSGMPRRQQESQRPNPASRRRR